MWCAKASVHVSFACEYNYYLVDESRNVLRWEAGKKRNLMLPQGVKEGDVVEIHDLWQVILEMFWSFRFVSGWCVTSQIMKFTTS